MLLIIATLLLAPATSFSMIGLNSLSILTTNATSTCDDGKDCRSLWQIVWSCLSTLFLCTWVSIHPNISGPHEHWSKVLLRRLGTMSAALIAPELMVSWAMRQRILARQLAKAHERYGWTETHGFFAAMGGFMAFEGDREIQVLLPEQLEGYSLTGRGDFPRITEEEITDKSKRDIIAKGLVMLQAGWFVRQCISRLVQGLPIAEIELVTIAFAVLSIAMFLLWWNKPFDVRRAIRVYHKCGSNTLPGCDEYVVEPELVNLEHTVGFGTRFYHSTKALITLPINIVLSPITLLIEIATGDSNHVVEGEKRISTFYPETSSVSSEEYTVLSGTIAATVFGAIHCIAWHFTFPSYTEKFLWRFSSIVITGAPSTFVLLVWFYTKKPTNIFAAMLVVLLPVYTICRIFLLILPFLSLRALPPNTYSSVQWITLIPHL